MKKLKFTEKQSAEYGGRYWEAAGELVPKEKPRSPVAYKIIESEDKLIVNITNQYYYSDEEGGGQETEHKNIVMFDNNTEGFNMAERLCNLTDQCKLNEAIGSSLVHFHFMKHDLEINDEIIKKYVMSIECKMKLNDAPKLTKTNFFYHVNHINKGLVSEHFTASVATSEKIAGIGWNINKKFENLAEAKNACVKDFLMTYVPNIEKYMDNIAKAKEAKEI